MNNEESKNESKSEIHGGNFYGDVSIQTNTSRENSKMKTYQYNNTSEDKKSLPEAAAEIQKLLDQLSQTYSPEEAKQKTAEEIAKKAQENPSFKESLKNLGKYLGTKAGETAVTEGVKQLIPAALALLL
ncbi:MAG: hypothetical protein F6K40_15375 [Okeania sp. SIO3I5]|uniref:hypothetical protein n=1 Tax=Okeania sp. SIO3I5 TaxID=2607805 RepID=UPI0013BAC587|nr:hypothetical protein [Okeania sp. SIO3I5]NEQ37573.1 hypothetical protein [Okeania sp. SIO3I5]